MVCVPPKTTLQLQDSALDTLKSLQQRYVQSKNISYPLEQNMLYSVLNTKVYGENYNLQLTNACPNFQPNYKVVENTTIGCAYDMSKNLGIENIVVLNFASAIKAGGGWLNGRVAQEEDIMRKTTLFTSIAPQDKFYSQHTKENPFYSHSLIYSPNVMIIKDNALNYVMPEIISVITSAAVNLTDLDKNSLWHTILKHNGSNDIVRKIMIERINRIIMTAIKHNHKNIVLGAFGCGVFGHNPDDVVEYFKIVLQNNGLEKYFENIYFAIWDTSPNKNTLKTFQNNF